VEGFTAPGVYAPGLLPPDFEETSVASRPIRAPGTQPAAAVLLVEFEILETVG